MPTRRDDLVLEGIRYQIGFVGFDAPMEARASDGTGCRLRPWTLGEHLSALADCLRWTADSSLALDSEAYADRVLAASGVDSDTESLRPLALWWAAGGGAQDPPILDGDWLDLGPARARLRPWSAGERLESLGSVSGSDPSDCRPVDFLRSMLACSVVALEPGIALLDLDSGASARLLAGAIGINEAGSGPEGRSLEASRTTLRICRALGWTPAQVWSIPAPELDRLVRLLDRVEGRTPPPRASGLAAHPDAVVIRIEDDRE